MYVNLVNFGAVTPEFNIAKVYTTALVSFFKTNFSYKLSQHPVDRFSPNFHRMVGI